MHPKPSRKEARAERANLKKVRDEEKKARLSTSPVASTAHPRTGELPSQEKTPRAEVDPNAWFKEKMTWCVTRKDVDGAWSWGQKRQWSAQDYDSHIGSTLSTLSGSTWQQIHQMTSKGLQMHHAQAVSSLEKEVQDRWASIGLEMEEAFRFRLTGRRRAWGYRIGTHFFMVWYDALHRFYLVEKSHT